MTDTLRSKLPDLMVTVAAVLITAVVGGGTSMYISYRIFEYRLSQLEERMEKSQVDKERMFDMLAEMGRDVAYLRGVQERK